MRKISIFSLIALFVLLLSSCTDDKLVFTTVDFEDVTLNGDTILKDTSFNSKNISFDNYFTDYGGGFTAWSGFACSSKTDQLTAGYTNDLSVYNTNAASGSKFAVFYYSSYDPVAYFSFPNNDEHLVKELKINNNTYAYLSFRDGDGYAKKFEAGDWCKVSIKGFNATNIIQGSVDFYLADFREGKSYICQDWTNVNLTDLGLVNKLSFNISSSDNNDYGMKTPAYLCIDDITYIQ